MDLNYVLLWLVALSMITTVIQLLRQRAAGHRGTWMLLAAILVITAAAWFWVPTVAGYVGGGLWLVFLAVPAILWRMMFRATQRQKYAQARRIAQVISLLRPSRAFRRQVRSLRAMELAQAGDLAQAALLFAERDTPRTAIDHLTKAQILRMGGRWEALASFCSQELDDADFEREPGLMVLYLRALGETGDRDGLFATYRRFERWLEQPGHGALRDVAWLYLFSFGGRRAQVEALLRGRLSAYPPAIQRFWTATADWAAGRHDAAERAFRVLERDGDRMVRLGAEQRLAKQYLYPPEHAHPPAHEQQELLARLTKELDQEQRYGMDGGARPAATAVYAFVALNMVAFALELVAGGSTQKQVLFNLGALFRPALWAGESWRLVTFMFLHYGLLHLLMNMLGLYLLGPFVEFSLGKARFVVIYLLSGLSGGVLWLLLPDPRPGLLIGASGCVMGIVGAMVAVLFRGYRREKARVAFNHLFLLMFFIIAQIAFDLSTREISFTAHASGIVVGFFLASLMAHRVSKLPDAGAHRPTAEAARS